MEHNETAQGMINTALLPNFLFLVGMVVIMGLLWYLLEYKR